MNLHEDSQRGHEAKMLLENKLYKEAISGLRENIITSWRNAPVRDRDGMHELKLMDKLLTDIERYIKQIADTGKMADIQLEKDAKLAELKKKGIR